MAPRSAAYEAVQQMLDHERAVRAAMIEPAQRWTEIHRASVEAVRASSVIELLARLPSPELAYAAEWQQRERLIQRAAREAAEQSRRLTESLVRLPKWIERRWPPNWPDDPDYAVLANMAVEEGLPVIWVPGSELLAALVSAADRQARVDLLVEAREQVLGECRARLADVDHDGVAEWLPLAEEAICSIEADRHASAQTLAVTVADALLKKHLRGRTNYGLYRDSLKVDHEDVRVAEIRRTYALYPVVPFLTEWHGGDQPLPGVLSRHVTVHFAHPDHLHEGNALVAIMLMTSLFCLLDEHLYERDRDAKRDDSAA
ncbi:MAG TPA: hypothetical protein VHB92_04515 [Humibacter sp.]|nr:hypothetical protein [Humibacter sp.]